MQYVKHKWGAAKFKTSKNHNSLPNGEYAIAAEILGTNICYSNVFRTEFVPLKLARKSAIGSFVTCKYIEKMW